MRRFEHVRRDKREDDGCVGFNHMNRRAFCNLATRDLFAGWRARVPTVARRRLGDLGKIRPQPHIQPHVLSQQWHRTDGEVARNAAADLEEADAIVVIGLVPLA